MHSDRTKSGGFETTASAMVRKDGPKVSILLEIDTAEPNTEARRLAKLFNVSEDVFPPGVDVYTALAAHVADVKPHQVSKLQRNYVKSRLYEWIYNGR